MPLTNYPNGLSSFGIPVLPTAGLIFTGKAFFVDAVTGSNGNNGKSVKKAFATLSKAHSAMTAGKNDVVYIIGNGAMSGTTRESETLVWSKNACHIIGIAAPTRVAQRARMSWTSGVSDQTLVTFSADGCVVANTHFVQDHDTGEANTCIAMTGQRNYFVNCHIAGGGHITGAAHASATSLTLVGDGENTFENCTLGLDTITSGAGANAVVAFSSAAVRNQFINCDFLKMAGSSGGLFLTANVLGTLDRFTTFQSCRFINAVASQAETIDAAIAIHEYAGGMIILDNCALIGTSNWVAADSTNVWLYGASPGETSGGNLNTGMAHTFDLE